MPSLNAGPRGNRMRILTIGTTMLCLAASIAPARAAITDKVKKACQGDYHRLCPGYKIGSTQLRACMEAKQNDISWSCIQALMDAGEVDKQKVAKNRR